MADHLFSGPLIGKIQWYRPRMALRALYKLLWHFVYRGALVGCNLTFDADEQEYWSRGRPPLAWMLPPVVLALILFAPTPVSLAMIILVGSPIWYTALIAFTDHVFELRAKFSTVGVALLVGWIYAAAPQPIGLAVLALLLVWLVESTRRAFRFRSDRTFWDECYRAAPNKVRCILNHAYNRYRGNEDHQTEQLYLKAIALASGDERIKTEANLVRLYCAQGRFDEAESRINGVLTEHPENAPMRLSRGIWRFQHHDLEGALEDFSWVCDQANGRSVIALTNRAQVRFELGDLEGSAQDLHETATHHGWDFVFAQFRHTAMMATLIGQRLIPHPEHLVRQI